MFHLQAHIDALNEKGDYQFRLRAENQADFTAWQSELRAALAKVLGILPAAVPPSPKVEELARIYRSKYTEVKYRLALEELTIPFYLLIPQTPPPYRLIMAFHGHAPSVHLILGNYPDEQSRQAAIAQDDNFAQRFAEDGYMVCAIEQRGFGERLSEQCVSGKQNSCRHLAFEYLMHGKTLLGERVKDAIAVLNYLGSRDDILLDKIACTGHSGGATTALFLSALDTRIFATVISGYFCAFKDSILAMEHCECNYIPNLLTLAEIGEIAALAAPRFLKIINGKDDPIFPLKGIEAPYQILQQAYTLAEAPQALSLSIHEGRHRYDYGLSRNYLNRLMANS